MQTHTPLTGLSFAASANPPDELWVTVICICFNQADFVEQALESVVGQTYPWVELIVIDNGSTDASAARIAGFAQKNPALICRYNPENLGLNRAFNQGLRLARGQYIIDLAADDLLFPDRIARQVACFTHQPEHCAVVFTNAMHINADESALGYHFAIRPDGRARVSVPTGNVFCAVLRSYFICTPTMMMRRSALLALGGYDETLAYEDFDFWVRSARVYTYAYLDEVLTAKRIVQNAFSRQILQRHNALLPTTLVVCQKAYALCQTASERKALAFRVRGCIRKAFYAESYELAHLFAELLEQVDTLDWVSRLILCLCRWQIPVNKYYNCYRQWFTKR